MSEPPSYPSYPNDPNQQPNQQPGQPEGSTPPPPPPPPPASGGYGYPSAPPPPPGSIVDSYAPTAAIGQGWGLFKAHWLPFVAMAVITGIIAGALDRAGGGGAGEVTTGSVIAQILGQVVSILFSAAMLKGAFDAIDGKEVSFGSMFSGWNKLQVILVAILVSILTTIGIVLLIIPGLIVLFLTWFSSYGVVDQDMSAIEGIKASFKFTTSNVGDMLLLMLLNIGVFILGILCLIVGVFVALPVVLCASAWSWRELGGGRA